MPRRRNLFVVYQGKPPKGMPYRDGMAEFVDDEPSGPPDCQVGLEERPMESQAVPPRKRDS